MVVSHLSSSYGTVRVASLIFSRKAQERIESANRKKQETTFCLHLFQGGKMIRNSNLRDIILMVLSFYPLNFRRF